MTAVIVLGSAGAAHATIHDLGVTGMSAGNFNPSAVNSDGNVAGAAVVAGAGGCPSAVGHAAVWHRSTRTWTRFGGFGGPTETDRSSAAYDINDANRIVGAADASDNCNERQAFRSENGAAVVDLDAPGGGINYSAALAVNSTGAVAGFSVVTRAASGCDVLDASDFGDIANNDCPQPAVWASGSAPGALAAMDADANEWMIRGISDTGRMVGYRFPGGGYRWDSAAGAATALPGMVPREHGISPNGKHVVGNSGATPRYYDYDGNVAMDLAMPAGATSAQANAVNDAEEIVGTATIGGAERAVLWDGRAATPVLLDTLYGAAASGWQLRTALDISNGGFIVGLGTTGGQPHGFLLDTPLVVNNAGDEPDTNAADGICDAKADPGPQCTLRAAIETVNAKASTTRTGITFDITGGLPAKPVITAASALPEIRFPVEIDGTSQAGVSVAAGEPRIVLKGGFTGTTASPAGLQVHGGSSIVRGLVLTGFPGAAVSVAGSGGDVIAGNWIGVTFDGTTYVDAGNGFGIDVGADNVRIGGTAPADRNVITGNGEPHEATVAMKSFSAVGSEAEKAAALRSTVRALGAGILLEASSTGTTITGNYVGVGPGGDPFGDPSTPASIGNVAGIMVAPADGRTVRNVTIGGAAAAANVVSGNVMGIAVLEAPAATIDDVSVRSNKIGVDAKGTGSTAVFFGNIFGVLVTGGANAVKVGAPGEGNAVQGNLVGINALGPRPTALEIRNNDIGAGTTLASWADKLKEPGTAPVNTLNIFGIWLINTEGAVVDGNTVTGNFIGAASNGNLVSANTYTNNVFGRKVADAAAFGRDMQFGELAGLIGFLSLANGADVIQGNTIGGNAIGHLAVNTTGATWTGNTIDYNAIGLVCGSCHRVNLGSTGAAPNTISRNLVGALFAHRELSQEELDRAKLQYRELIKEQRDAAVNSDDAAPFATLLRAFSGDDGSTELTDQQLDEINTSNTHRIENNLIGATSATDAPTDGRTKANEIGVWVLGDVTDTTIGKTGGAAPGAGGNVIAHNRQAGIWMGPGVKGHWPRRIKVRSNRIFDNGWNQLFPGVPGMGIDLIDYRFGVDEAAFGPTANDDQDPDDGPNGFQNYPELAGGAPTKAGGSRVVGMLNSRPRTTYKVEFFATARCNKYSHGEGEIILGEKVVTTGPDGVVVFDVSLPGSVKVGQFITTTATEETDKIDGLGTSEFSRCAPVAATAPRVIVGKRGADQLTGTAGNDLIDGRGGNDRIDGRGGNDVLIGGNGNDIIITRSGGDTVIGGNGNDTVLLDVNLTFRAVNAAIKSAMKQLDAHLNTAIVAGRAAGPAPKAARGKLVGNDVVRGGTGNDIIISKGGADVLMGGAGNDRILGGTGAERLHGDAGNDRIVGGAGNDRIWGGAGNDRITGSNGNDLVDGEAGTDVLVGGAGRDTILGGVGNDVINALDKLKDIVNGGPGRDAARVDRRIDTVTQVESRTYSAPRPQRRSS